MSKPFLVKTSANIKHGEIAGSVTAAQLPDIPVTTKVLLKAQASNVGKVYIGSSNAVTVAAGTTDTTTGIELSAVEPMEFHVQNLNLLYLICNNAGDDLTFIVY